MQVDPRGQRWAAAVTTVVPGTMPATQSRWPLAGRPAGFAIAAVQGARHASGRPLAKMQARPRPDAPREPQAAGPHGSAQAGYACRYARPHAKGPGWLGNGAIAIAPGKGLPNAAFGFCLREMYLLTRRSTPKIRSDREVPA
ncbi:hypothetical protein Acsp04_48960 [Actinomadura sp. NBRC 104425]|uniref:DUF4395 family protein n=1 Tax=Actinomadura sp. NBRC 104425 TaxID=3032204 RepID=UPI0024A3722D|nr:DUF4395 family protein [Actinomadura sp. NBRC 104425]GLZ14661.1 hypothetical protein Acsp04_48960 [Actinomadura sp. NBRC 104425]